jgi:heptosyltransferase-2
MNGLMEVDMKPKLLVLELWGLGDLVIATPFLRAATGKYTVTLLAKPFAVEMCPRLWPEVKIVPFTAPWTAFRFGAKYGLWRWPWGKMSRLLRDLQAEHFDCGVSGRWDPRDHFLLKLAGARERVGFSRWRSDRYLTRTLARPQPLAHRHEYWRTVGAALGLVLPPAADYFRAPGPLPGAVLVHTGARLPLRVWPLQNFQEIVRRLRQQGYPVRIACDEDQLDWWAGQGEQVACPGSVADLLGCLDQAGLFIGNDSGPGHLAASDGRPTFTLFGPQLSEWFAPLHPTAEWIDGKACPYKPCSDYCRFDAPFCLRGISVEEAWERVEPFVRRHLAGAR